MTANYPNIAQLAARSADADVNNSQVFRSVGLLHQSQTISHRAAAAPGPEVRRERPMT